MKSRFKYLQVTKDKSLVFNPSKIMVADCYADADLSGMCEHQNPQDTICDKSRIGFLETFDNCTLLWV